MLCLLPFVACAPLACLQNTGEPENTGESSGGACLEDFGVERGIWQRRALNVNER